MQLCIIIFILQGLPITRGSEKMYLGDLYAFDKNGPNPIFLGSQG